MDEVLEFAHSLAEAEAWLQGAQSTLEDFSSECDGENAEVIEALSRFDAAKSALAAIREPLSGQIKAAEDLEKEMETHFSAS